MADGWLFRLRSTLGAPHAVPAWPASAAPRDTRGERSPDWPALRDPAAGPDPVASHDPLATPPRR